ncbi:MAG: lipopolysaccharide heptosyltransferase II [Magnetococcales bacterium]|nr:lipopolysaccharide heptosyltransferase II [Magnetococcales bacterium]
MADLGQTAPRGVVVVGPSWVGDMMLAQGLFRQLKQQDADEPIDVVAPPWSLGLLRFMPEIRRVHPLEVAHGEAGLRKRWQLGQQLAGEHYRRAIVLPRSFKSAIPPWVAAIPQRSGFLGEARLGLLNDWRLLDAKRLPRTIDRFVALALPSAHPLPSPLPQPRLQVERDLAESVAQRFGIALRADSPLLALCPGAEYGPAKQWPTDHWITFGRLAVERGLQPLIFGSAKEEPLGRDIATGIGLPAVNLAGTTTLDEAVCLLSLAHCTVSNDSGLMHVAAALPGRVIALFGSSDPRHTPPLSDNAVILWRQLPCSPCFKRRCPEQHLRCLREITPEQVMEQAP